jgi:hypothetical protein
VFYLAAPLRRKDRAASAGRRVRYPSPMRFNLEHRFSAPVDDVELAVLDQAYQELLVDLPNVAERAVELQEEREDGSVYRVVRYRFGGNLPGAVERAIGASTVIWDEVGTFRPDRHEWTFEIQPHVFRGRFTCTGRYGFLADGQGTMRALDGELRVAVPIVGGRVERAIHEGLVETMDAEAKILERYLQDRTEASR